MLLISAAVTVFNVLVILVSIGILLRLLLLAGRLVRAVEKISEKAP